MNIIHRVEFQIMKYLLFVLAVKEKCPPQGRGSKRGYIEQYLGYQR